MARMKKKKERSRFTEIRLIITYRFLRALITPILIIMYHYSYQKQLAKIKGPYLILCNHTTQLDPLLLGIAMKRHMFFVSSDHIFRKGFWSRALMYHIAPIARVKGKTDAYTVIQMIQSLRNGNNVCMFAEGNRSFDGLTGMIPDVTAKVIKKADVKVVTFRLVGGYFAEPRWGFSIRKGKMLGQLVNVYEKEDLKNMSIEEINDKIKADLFVDAYADQEKEKYLFKGKNRALGMETSMFMCPNCKEIGTLRSSGNQIACTCGFKAYYEEDGLLTGMPDGMHTLTKWNAFQLEELRKRIKEHEGQRDYLLFEDHNIRFYRVGKSYEIVEEKTGDMFAYPDRFVIAGEEIFIKDVPVMSMYARNTLAFTYQNEHCEVKGDNSYSSLKYKYLFEIINDKQIV